MLVGDAGAEASLRNALSQCQSFGMRQANARAIAEEVAHELEGWKDHFQAMGVADRDIQVLAQYLDGERLGT